MTSLPACISRDGDSTSLGNLCQCSVTLIVKQGCLMFRWHLLCFSLCPVPLLLSLATTEKSLALSSLHPPFRYFNSAFIFSSYRTAYLKIANADISVSIMILHPEENRLLSESKNEF